MVERNMRRMNSVFDFQNHLLFPHLLFYSPNRFVCRDSRQRWGGENTRSPGSVVFSRSVPQRQRRRMPWKPSYPGGLLCALHFSFSTARKRGRGKWVAASRNPLTGGLWKRALRSHPRIHFARRSAAGCWEVKRLLTARKGSRNSRSIETRSRRRVLWPICLSKRWWLPWRIAEGGYAYHVLNRGVGRRRLFGDARAPLDYNGEVICTSPVLRWNKKCPSQTPSRHPPSNVRSSCWNSEFRHSRNEWPPSSRRLRPSTCRS